MFGLLKGPFRRVIIFAISALIPLVVIAALVGVYFPKAPEVQASKATINSLSLEGLQAVNVDMDVDVDIVNKNQYPISFKPVDIVFYFPESPDVTVGTGVLQGGTVEAGKTATRSLHAVFDAPLDVVGVNFLRDMNRGVSTLNLKGEVLGYTSFLRTDFILASDMKCDFNYDWNSQATSHSCTYKPKVRKGAKDYKIVLACAQGEKVRHQSD